MPTPGLNLDHAILDSLAEAVTVQTMDGQLVYANEAAARILDAESPAALLATPPIEIMQRFDSFNEDGSPIRVEQLPGRRILLGELNPEPLVTRAINRRTGEERWRVTKSTAIRNPEGEVGWAVNIVDDITEVKRAEIAQGLLARAGQALASSMDYENTLGQVARLAVPQLADWCGVSLPDDRGHLIHSVAVAHVDPGKVRFAHDYNPTSMSDPAGTAEVIRSGRSELVTEIPDELLAQAIADPEQLELLRTIGMRSVMIVPMSAGGRTIGALSFVSAESGRTFTQADLELAEELGRRAGTAVENARLYTERSRIARTLQTGLLPPELPEIDGYATATLYRPAGEENWVGGDFYDALPVRDGWLFVVGDVAGRGASAAALTALARFTLRSSARLLDDPLRAVEQLNAELLERSEMSLCSVCCVLLRDGEATILCAGHPLPVLVRGDSARMVGRTGQMLGAYQAGTWTPETVALEPEDVLVLYTDGVLDTIGASERFGEARLLEALAGARDAHDAIAVIDDALERFHVGAQADDTAVLALTRTTARTLVVAGDARAPKTARDRVAAELAAHFPADALYDVRVLVSELVTNAVRHGGADAARPVRVTVRVEDAWARIAVWDPGPGFDPPDVPAARPEGGGNGLVMVQRIASRWGVERSVGTCVWFEIDRSPSTSG
jgi:serine phosphatase RsbU (regulator of sigma subunit)/anti-sigma regulatory factor (Ser/Thr protein kinase)